MAAGEQELLHAVSDLVSADRGMRHALSRRMKVGETDLRAIRFVMAAGRRGQTVTPRELADHLGISTASTTVVLDRLAAAGHLDRVPHPTDKRSKVLVATPYAYAEARGHLSATHDRMRQAASDVPVAARPAVVAFLEALADAMRAEDTDPS